MNRKRTDTIYMTWILIAINCAIFMLMELSGGTDDARRMAEVGGMWPPSLHIKHEYWRLFTACFLHYGFEHLLNNMFLLACAGNVLEKAMGHVRYLILYLVAGIGGNALSYAYKLYTGEYAVSAGASGAIFGIVGALLWVVIRHRGHYESLTGQGMAVMIALCLCCGLFGENVDNWAHLGGLITGFLMAVILYRKKPKYVDFSKQNPYTN